MKSEGKPDKPGAVARSDVVRPPRIELGLRVPETLVISLSLRARKNFLPPPLEPVNSQSSIVPHLTSDRTEETDRLLIPGNRSDAVLAKGA
jgi:hypothetical protein